MAVFVPQALHLTIGRRFRSLSRLPQMAKNGVLGAIDAVLCLRPVPACATMRGYECGKVILLSADKG